LSFYAVATDASASVRNDDTIAYCINNRFYHPSSLGEAAALAGTQETMNTTPPSSPRAPFQQSFSVFLTLIVLAAASFTVGCGGGNSTPKFSGNTVVTVVLTGAANDQLSEFDLGIQNLTLTGQSGSTVSLAPAIEGTEFIHLNGRIEPLVTISIPQGIYTSATATLNGAEFTCITLTPQGGLDTSTFAYQGGANPVPGDITVNLPAPITVTGDSMALLLNLQVAQSASFSSCSATNGIATFAITPTFNLTPAAFTSQPTNSANGKAFEINGQVSSINSSNDGFVLAYPQVESPRAVTVSTGAGTAYQGISSFAELTVGTFVDMDGAVQSDGSLAAARIDVEDPNATSFLTGPLLFESEAQPSLTVWGLQEQGVLFTGIHVVGGQEFSFGNATFQISSQLANLGSLPFTPSFNAASMVAGQNVFLSSTSDNVNGGFPFTPVSTLTLIPQTIDGTVSGTSSAGNFTVFTVSLASYDLFPTLAVQAGQTTLLSDPNEVEVYVDSSTQMLNSQPLSAQVGNSSTFRFYGLVFNDHGTLRMDCAQVSDGVSILPPNADVAMAGEVKGQVTVLSNVTAGPMRETNIRITPAH
jgi:hypothetical protein